MKKATDLLSIGKMFKNALTESLDQHLAAGAAFDLLPEVLEEHVRKDAPLIDFTQMSEKEKDAVINLKELGRQFAGDQGAYIDGVLQIIFKNKQAALDYTNAIEEYDAVMGYEIEVNFENLPLGIVHKQEVDIEDVMFDGNYEFSVFVYIDPEIVRYSPAEIEVADEDGDGTSDEAINTDNGLLTEVRRRVKVNFRGARRIKMQCDQGFKWDATARACIKITGAEVAKMRKSIRQALRTKQAEGQSLKVRVIRKTRKAKRFRKQMGLDK